MSYNISPLKNAAEFFKEFYFEPFRWRCERIIEIEGFYRRITFRKGALLGEVAKYYVDDYIIWGYAGHSQESALKNLIKVWQPKSDVMSQRILLLGEKTRPEPLKKFFWFGFKGWIEVLPYKIGDVAHDSFKDLAHLVNKGTDLKIPGGVAQDNSDFTQG